MDRLDIKMSYQYRYRTFSSSYDIYNRNTIHVKAVFLQKKGIIMANDGWCLCINEGDRDKRHNLVWHQRSVRHKARHNIPAGYCSSPSDSRGPLRPIHSQHKSLLSMIQTINSFEQEVRLVQTGKPKVCCKQNFSSSTALIWSSCHPNLTLSKFANHRDTQ